MAFQTRGRDPLLDSNMQAAIEKRGKELIGLGLIVLGLIVAVMIGSYAPDDSNWMVSSDAPVQNWMGQTGASIAFILITFLGLGSWAISVFCLCWGMRFMLHRGAERIVWPSLMLIVWLIVVALHFETLLPDGEWQNFHSFGLGGMIGNTALGGLLALLPFGLAFLVKSLSFITALGAIMLGVFVLGFSRTELFAIGRFVVLGLILCYDCIARLLGRGATTGLQAAKDLGARRAQVNAGNTGAYAFEQDADSSAQEQAIAFAEAPFSDREEAPYEQAEDEYAQYNTAQFRTYPAVDSTPQTQPNYQAELPISEPEQPKLGLFSRASSFIRGADAASEPVIDDEVIEGIEGDPFADLENLSGDERISQKIANAVRIRRARTAPDMPLTKGRGKRPEPLIFNPNKTAAATTGVEPLLTAEALQPTLAAPSDMLSEEGSYDHETMAGAHIDYQNYDHIQPSEPALDSTMSEHQPEYQSEAEAISAQFGDSFDKAGHEAAPLAQTRIARSETVAPAPIVPVSDIPVAQERKAVVEKPQTRSLQPSTRARAEAQPNLFNAEDSDFELPPLSLLASADNIERHHLSDEALEENARMLENVLDDYGIKGEIVSVRPGPVVTMYELEPAPGLKASRVIGLADDIARSMSALSARVSTVPGRSVIGIELPNENREMVSFREMLSSRDYGDGNQALPLALGKDIGGDAVVANLAKMPHLLIAGTTGSGKSVAINTMILSLLYKLTPDECRLIMIDPKMLELSVYDGIPHLLSPVVTDPKKAVVALKWAVGEMEDRYRKMSKMGVRNIAGYNGRVAEALAKDEMFSRTVQTGFDEETGEPIFETEEFEPKKLPYIVVIVDEMADLMMVAGKEIEACIQRLAQMARASGIHLVMATQRPSVDVITGTIKANFPTRISFQVTSKIDSRTILGEMGAEQLLGMGDMLYMAGGSKITRCHGPFVSDEEVEEVVNHLKQFGPPEYVGGVLDGPSEDKAENIDAVLGLNTGGNTNSENALYDQAVAIVIKDRKCSTSYIQRKLGIGYNKAARLVEQMEEERLVSSANHVGKREILVPEQ